MSIRPGARFRAVFATLVVALVSASGVHAQENAGQVQVVVGAAQLIDFSGKARALERGAEVRQGDRIVTGEGALVQMKMTDGALISVRTDTDVTVEKYRHDEKASQNSSMLLKLARGALRSITGLIGGNNPDAYKIATPTATIGIRGTDHEPVFIPEPKPGETPMAPPGTYDKVNSGATTITTQIGTIDIKPGQVGFVPIAPGMPPKLLPAVPDFFKRLDAKGDSAGRGTKEGGDGKMLARPMIKTLDPSIKPLATGTEPIKTETTLSPTLSPVLIETAPTLTTATKLEPATTTTLIAPTTTIQPTTTLIAPTTTIQPTSTLIAPTTIIQPTNTLIAPTTTTTIKTISPTTTTISPTLLK